MEHTGLVPRPVHPQVGLTLFQFQPQPSLLSSAGACAASCDKQQLETHGECTVSRPLPGPGRQRERNQTGSAGLVRLPGVMAEKRWPGEH